MAYALAGSASSQIVSALIHGINEWPKSREMPAYENVRDWQILLQGRKSNDPENLAKGDFQKAVTLRSAITPLRRSVVVFRGTTWCLTSPRPTRVSAPENFRSSSQKDFCNKICQQRNFRGHLFNLPPFAGNPNGVVVYPPYLMDQYCGMLLRIWWH